MIARGKVMRTLIGALTAVLFATPASFAQKGQKPLSDGELLSAQPGVEITHRTEGDVDITEWKKNGVSIRQEQKGSKVTSFGNDASGKGAVLCALQVEVAIRAGLDACPSEKYQDLKNDLDESIAAINTFVLANSIRPTTLDQIRAQEASIQTSLIAKIGSDNENSQKSCENGDLIKMTDMMAAMSRDERRKHLADVLSIPRWPVMNPCL
jgi:hypothetical protein